LKEVYSTVYVVVGLKLSIEYPLKAVFATRLM